MILKIWTVFLNSITLHQSCDTYHNTCQRWYQPQKIHQVSGRESTLETFSISPFQEGRGQKLQLGSDDLLWSWWQKVLYLGKVNDKNTSDAIRAFFKNYLLWFLRTSLSLKLLFSSYLHTGQISIQYHKNLWYLRLGRTPRFQVWLQSQRLSLQRGRCHEFLNWALTEPLNHSQTSAEGK